jgi:ABC-type transporter Mla subunit MlaD
MANRGTRDNMLAGAFVIGGAALAVWASFMLGERAVIGGVNHVTVRFPVAVGSHGLKPGAMVALGGQKIGTVSSVAFHPQDLTPSAVDVSIEVPHSLKLMNNAVFTLERPLLGSLSSINITSATARWCRACSRRPRFSRKRASRPPTCRTCGARSRSSIRA